VGTKSNIRSSDWDAKVKLYMAEQHQHNSMQSSLPQRYQCSASLQSGQFSLPAMLQSSRLPYVTSPWRQVLCYIMYLDGSAAVLLFLLGFAEVQLAVMGWKLLVLMMTCTLASGFDLQFSGAA